MAKFVGRGQSHGQVRVPGSKSWSSSWAGVKVKVMLVFKKVIKKKRENNSWIDQLWLKIYFFSKVNENLYNYLDEVFVHELI